MADNQLVKTVGTLATVGGAIFLGLKFLDRQKEQETIKAQQAVVKSDAINSAKPLTTVTDEVKKLISTNPNLKTYTNAEYKNFASSLYEYFKNKNMAGLVTVFGKMKTNVDLMLLSIYYGVKVFKSDDIFSSFEIKTYNLGQSIANLTNPVFQDQLRKLLATKKITFNLF